MAIIVDFAREVGKGLVLFAITEIKFSNNCNKKKEGNSTF